MNYKPSYLGEMIEPNGSSLATAPDAFEELPDALHEVVPARPATTNVAQVENPETKPGIEFLDLDEIEDPGVSETVMASDPEPTSSSEPEALRPEVLFLDLDDPKASGAPSAVAQEEPATVSEAPEPEVLLQTQPEVLVDSDPRSEIVHQSPNAQEAQPEPRVETVARPENVVAPAVSPVVPAKPVDRRPSLAVRGVEDAQKAPRRVAMQQAINSWTVASGVLKMIIMHPGYTSSLDDKLAGIEVTRHALDQAAAKLEDTLGFPKNEGSRQKAKRHLLPVMESVWGYLFSHAPADVSIDQVVGFATKFLAESADLLSADPDELFLRSDRNLDLALARLTAMTRVQCELQPIFDVIDKYSQKNPAISKIFFGEMSRRAVLDDIFRLVEDVASSFEDGVDFSHLDERDKAIVRRVVLRQSVDLMSGILRSDTVMAKLSAFAKEAPKKEGILKEWITSQYAEWTEGMPSLAAMVETQVREQGLSEARKGPTFS